MGQYYKPVILAKNKKTIEKCVSPYDYGNGAKLMEHSWLGNNLVLAFESLIYKNPQHVVWAGDYADECKGRKTNLYERCKESNEVKPTAHLKADDVRFIVNHTKKEFVDTNNVLKITASWVGDEDYRIHPLPLLTCEGNGRGGGDFRNEDNHNIVGSWARDLISAEPEMPKDYVELMFDLIEN